MAYCRVYLPSKARIVDVADVLAILTWAKASKSSITSKMFYTVVHSAIQLGSADFASTSVTISWKIYGDGKKVSKAYYFEMGDGFHGLVFSATDIGLALGKRLVDFFGGKCDYNDGDGIKCDYTRPVRNDLTALEGELYQCLQERKFKLKPITQKEVDDLRVKSFYFHHYNMKTILDPANKLYAEYTF